METAGEGSLQLEEGQKGEGGESEAGWKSVEGRFPGLCGVIDIFLLLCFFLFLAFLFLRLDLKVDKIEDSIQRNF